MNNLTGLYRSHEWFRDETIENAQIARGLDGSDGFGVLEADKWLLADYATPEPPEGQTGAQEPRETPEARSGDTREKLEADASELVATYCASGVSCDAMMSDIRALLDRQAAITERELDEFDELYERSWQLRNENNELCLDVIADYNRENAELKAEVDALEREADSLAAVAAQLRMFRDCDMGATPEQCGERAERVEKLTGGAR